MFEKAKENILGGGAMSPALITDDDIVCSVDGEQAFEFHTVHNGSTMMEAAYNTGCFEEDEAVNEAAERLRSRYVTVFLSVSSMLCSACLSWSRFPGCS